MRKNAFQNFYDYKPGVFDKNAKFSLKSNFNTFGWKVCDRISDAIETMLQTDIQQNMSNKERTSLRNSFVLKIPT